MLAGKEIEIEMRRQVEFNLTSHYILRIENDVQCTYLAHKLVIKAIFVGTAICPRPGNSGGSWESHSK